MRAPRPRWTTLRATALFLLAVPGLGAAAPGDCANDLGAKLYLHANFSGACAGFSLSDFDFSDDTFPGTNIPLNDQVSSINVKFGWAAVVCTDANLLGVCEVYTDSSGQVLFNDAISSILVRPLI